MAGRTAVFVNVDRHMDAIALHFAEQAVDLFGPQGQNTGSGIMWRSENGCFRPSAA
jgi:hypothetical protein